MSECSTRLREQVWDLGRCSGCGGCVGICPADALYFDIGEMHPRFSGYCKQETDGVSCNACNEVCPRLAETAAPVGSVLRVVAAKREVPISQQQSGGAVTYILAQALDAGLLDGVITMSVDRFSQAPIAVLNTSSGQLIESAGSRYNWNAPLLSVLKEANRWRLSRIAVVGTPCIVSAARMIAESSHDLVVPYGKMIRLIVGLFCTESFDHMAFIQTLAEKGISTGDITGMDVKGALVVTLRGGVQQKLPLAEFEEAIRPGCHVCDDFSAGDADISAGSVGTAGGWTTLLIRTKTGEQFLQDAVLGKGLLIEENVDMEVVGKFEKEKKERS
ncbi:MAG: Coenzyme F420 hydrogenase/dehydrogenase, beta subunit C-terminal domain [Methanomicrobiales archaeon]|jgi:coenzyme F420 hydrogenase subunit beta|nr:Coenzyme F420 hydrogenase/dehydrogenase, beta subunit C-terminal domain [Methanomicrobiales archaeon]